MMPFFCSESFNPLAKKKSGEFTTELGQLSGHDLSLLALILKLSSVETTHIIPHNSPRLFKRLILLDADGIVFYPIGESLLAIVKRLEGES